MGSRPSEKTKFSSVRGVGFLLYQVTFSHEIWITATHGPTTLSDRPVDGAAAEAIVSEKFTEKRCKLQMTRWLGSCHVQPH